MAPCAPFEGGNQHAAEASGAVFTMWPNPNHDGRLNLSLNEVNEGVGVVYVEVYDPHGRRVRLHTIPTQGAFTTLLELGDLSTGMYIVNVTAGTRTYTERLVVQ
jgi:hypothetical protein